MKVVKLTAENIKKLVAVEITPDGELVEVTGRNAQGKSSVLDSIFWALAGTKHIQAVPIRAGQDKARIRLDLGEVIVERRFTPKGSVLTVETADGARYDSPQKLLDGFLGALAFDPLAFVNEDQDEQLTTLRGLVPLDVDVDKLDALNRGDYDRRTDVNREARSKRAQADGVTVPAGLPEAPVDTQALVDRMTSAAAANAEIETRKGRRQAAEREVEELRRKASENLVEVARLRAEADRLEEGTGHLTARADTIEKKLQEAEVLPEPVDIEALGRELTAAQETNRGLEQRARKLDLQAEAERLEGQARQLTEAMEAREQEKAAAIARAQMPVPGLGFGAGFVTLNGLPFAQASSAEQLRVSVAIAMAANPKLRVLRIKEGSLLDEDNLALIGSMAAEKDYQVWIERVDTSGTVGIVIEDGQVKAVNPRRKPAKTGA